MLLAVGYGDIYPVTVYGKLVSMISSIVGIAVVALLAGVITGDILRRLRRAGKIRFHIIACIIQVC